MVNFLQDGEEFTDHMGLERKVVILEELTIWQGIIGGAALAFLAFVLLGLLLSKMIAQDPLDCLLIVFEQKTERLLALFHLKHHTCR